MVYTSILRREYIYTFADSCYSLAVPQVVNLLDEVPFRQTKDCVMILY
jgi:hypothetical protein